MSSVFSIIRQNRWRICDRYWEVSAFVKSLVAWRLVFPASESVSASAISSSISTSCPTWMLVFSKAPSSFRRHDSTVLASTSGVWERRSRTDAPCLGMAVGEGCRSSRRGPAAGKRCRVQPSQVIAFYPYSRCLVVGSLVKSRRKPMRSRRWSVMTWNSDPAHVSRGAFSGLAAW